MLIGTFRTIPLTNTEGEVGYMECELEIPWETIRKEPSKKDFIMREIALTLQGLCIRHGTPREVWDFSPSDKVRKLTLLPESIPFR
jgi:hypothetical protein